jgi:hypothetical protein
MYKYILRTWRKGFWFFERADCIKVLQSTVIYDTDEILNPANL